MLFLDIPDFKLLIIAIRTAAEQAQEDINLTTGNITSGTCQKLVGGEGGRGVGILNLGSEMR